MEFTTRYGCRFCSTIHSGKYGIHRHLDAHIPEYLEKFPDADKLLKANLGHLHPVKVIRASRSRVRGGRGIDWDVSPHGDDSLPGCVAWVLVIPIRSEMEKQAHLALDRTELTTAWWERFARAGLNPGENQDPRIGTGWVEWLERRRQPVIHYITISDDDEPSKKLKKKEDEDDDDDDDDEEIPVRRSKRRRPRKPYKGKGKESDVIDLEVTSGTASSKTASSKTASSKTASSSSRKTNSTRSFRSDPSSSNVVQSSHGSSSKVVNGDQATNVNLGSASHHFQVLNTPRKRIPEIPADYTPRVASHCPDFQLFLLDTKETVAVRPGDTLAMTLGALRGTLSPYLRPGFVGVRGVGMAPAWVRCEAGVEGEGEAGLAEGVWEEKWGKSVWAAVTTGAGSNGPMEVVTVSGVWEFS